MTVPVDLWRLLILLLIVHYIPWSVCQSMARRFAVVAQSRIAPTALIALVCMVGWITIASVLSTPIPKVTDEFSYLLGADTFAEGRLANPPPPFLSSFDTPHVLSNPHYATKYFPAQSTALALGQVFFNHAVVGVWLSSWLAAVAIFWMLAAWVGRPWALAGALLFVLQIGLLSYWSQSYWGGMVAALGGALYLGSIRRLWQKPTRRHTVTLCLGLAILLTSRPVEGLVLALISCAPAAPFCRQWARSRLALQQTVISIVILASLLVSMSAYNRAVTGSALLTPYMLHERQYQRTPQLTVLPRRAALAYSSDQIRRYYEGTEGRLYRAQQQRRNFFPQVVAWWAFFAGPFLTAPIIIVALKRNGSVRALQAVLIPLWLLAPMCYRSASVVGTGVLLTVVTLQGYVLWRMFADMWERVALATCGALLLESFFVKWMFPHYFAPATGAWFVIVVAGVRSLWRSGQDRRERKIQGAPGQEGPEGEESARRPRRPSCICPTRAGRGAPFSRWRVVETSAGV